VLQKVDGVDDHLLNIEDNLLDIEDNLFNIEDNLLNIEDNLDNVIENLADVIENLANVDENLADLEDKIGENVADRLLNGSNFAQNAVPPDLFRVFGGIYHMGEPIGPPLIVSRGAAGRRRTLNGAPLAAAWSFDTLRRLTPSRVRRQRRVRMAAPVGSGRH
jgi:hypothetical protein